MLALTRVTKPQAVIWPFTSLDRGFELISTTATGNKTASGNLAFHAADKSKGFSFASVGNKTASGNLAFHELHLLTAQ